MLLLVKLWVIKLCLNLGLESEFGNSNTGKVYLLKSLANLLGLRWWLASEGCFGSRVHMHH